MCDADPPVSVYRWMFSKMSRMRRVDGALQGRCSGYSGMASYSEASKA